MRRDPMRGDTIRLGSADPGHAPATNPAPPAADGQIAVRTAARPELGIVARGAAIVKGRSGPPGVRRRTGAHLGAGQFLATASRSDGAERIELVVAIGGDRVIE